MDPLKGTLPLLSLVVFISNLPNPENITFSFSLIQSIDDMGKLGVNELPKKSPEWCPLKEK